MRSLLRLFARLSLANLRRHRLRWVLTILGIAFGVGGFFGVLTISRSIVFAFEESVVRTAGSAHFQVSNGSVGVDRELIDVVRAVDGVDAASGSVQFNVTLPELGRRVTVLGMLLGSEQAHGEDQFGNDVLQLPDRLGFVAAADSIALSTDVLAELGGELGAKVGVLGPKGARELVVRGALRPTGALRIFGGDVALMDAQAAQLAFGELDRFHWVDVITAPDVEVEDVRARLAEAVAGRGVVETPFGRGKRMDAMLATLRWMLTLSGVVAMLVGVFLIHHTVVMAVRQRESDLVKLRSLGATRYLLFVHLLAESLAIGVLGAVLGVALGLGFSKLANGLLGTAVSNMYAPIPPPPVSFSWKELGIAFALGIFTVGLAAAIPCGRMLRLRPLAGHGEGAPDEQSGGMIRSAVAGVVAILLSVAIPHACGKHGLGIDILLVAAFTGLLFVGTTLLVPLVLRIVTPIFRVAMTRRWGTLGTWAWQQVRKRQFHTATTMGALASGVTFTLAMAMLLGSYRSAFTTWIDQMLNADVFINPGKNVSLLAGPTIDTDLIPELERIDGVSRVMPWRLVEVEYRGRPIIVQGLPEQLIERLHPEVVLDHQAGEVVISDTLAERYGLDVGDDFELPAPVAPLQLRVASVRPDYALDLGNVKVGWTLFAQHFREHSANVLVVDAATGVSGRDLKRRIEATLAGRYDVSVLTGDELRSLVDALIDQSFGLTYGMQMLALVVTVLAMINATSAAIVDRGPELTTWRALGLERPRLVRLLGAEAGLVGLLACVMGIGAGTLMGGSLVRVIAPAVAGFRMDVETPLGIILLLVIMTSFAAGVAALVVAGWQTRGAVAQAGTYR